MGSMLDKNIEDYWDEVERQRARLLEKEKPSALTKQEGGSHYKKYAIQPIEYALKNNLNFAQANAIKYITRYRDKGGSEDLLKAIHNIELLLELEYPEAK